MAKRDASKKLGGMAGAAATSLRNRASVLDAAINGPTPAKRAMRNAVKGKPAPKKSRY